MRCLAIAVVCATLGAASPARADSCPPIAGGHPSLSQVDSGTRYRFLAERMRKARRHAKIWNYSWVIGFLGASAAQLGASPLFEDEGFRTGLYVGAGKAFVAGVFGIVRPLKVFSPGKTDRAEPAAAEAARLAVCARLAAMERAVLATARREQRMKGWRMWVAGFALNVAGVVALAVMDYWREATTSMLIGIPVAQVKIWTQPMVATETLRAYRMGRLGDVRAGSGSTVTIAPGPNAGLSLRVDF